MPHQRRADRPPKPVYTVTLTCGHTIRLRDEPWDTACCYGCTAALGCGYQLAWTQWVSPDGQQSGQNPAFGEAGKPPPGPG